MIGQTTLYQKPKESAIAKLSLISLMDIFTILVFFLMFNSGETQNIETAKIIKLPDSVSGKSPRAELTIFVSEEGIIFNDVEIVTLTSIRQAPSDSIQELKDALIANTEALGKAAQVQEKIGHSITIMADKNVNYEILKSVMETCREENYRNISLAVNRVASQAIKSSTVSTPIITDIKEG